MDATCYGFIHRDEQLIKDEFALGYVYLYNKKVHSA